MRKARKIQLMVSAVAAAAIPLLSQTAPKPSFEVVSIKPRGANAPRGGGAPAGDRYAVSNITLRMLLQRAYLHQPSGPPVTEQPQIVGAPSWMDSDRYDIHAAADCSGGVLSPGQVDLMLQSMLEDRFQLKAHMETRELTVYNLVVAKDGARIKPSADQTPPPQSGPPQPCAPVPAAPAIPAAQAPAPSTPGQRGVPSRGNVIIRISPTRATIQGAAQPISAMSGVLQDQVGRPVVDKTDLKGLFDFTLIYAPENLPGALPPRGGGPPADAPADPLPSLFSALQELGLKLESAKGPLPVLVIESVQKPTEN
jgi:uncharacterized protein (TIGR03435 family)